MATRTIALKTAALFILAMPCVAATGGVNLIGSANPAMGQSSFTLTVAGDPRVDAGRAINLLVTAAPQIGSIQPVQLSCSGLPWESACTFGTQTLPVNGGTTSLQITTMAPHSCESAMPSSQNAGLPFTGPAVAALVLFFLPRGKSKPFKGFKGPLLGCIAVCTLTALTGCGNCTDLGTRPGDYTIKIIATETGMASDAVVARIVLHVTVP